MSSKSGFIGAFRSFLGANGNARRTGLKHSQYRASLEILEVRQLLVAPILLNSRPGAPVTLFLDVDGSSVDDPGWISFRTDGQTGPIITPSFDLDGDVTTFNAEETQWVEEIWNRVAEDYAPLDINVTTVDPGTLNDFEALRVVIGGDGAWSPPIPGGGRAGGYGTYGFNSQASNTSFVFSEVFFTAAQVASASSHESGHTFGLGHHSTWNADGTKNQEYNPGNADRAPIMGNGYSAARDVWDNGAGNIAATQNQDDLAVLTSAANSTVHFRADDFGSTTATAFDLFVNSPTFIQNGLIGQNGDQDFFRFETNTGSISFTADGLNLRQLFNNQALTFGTNLDIELRLYDSTGALIATAAPTDSLFATLSADVQQGTYFVSISGTGEYGALGQYTLTGNVIPLPSTPTMIGPVGTLSQAVPFFEWTVGANADHYQLQVNNRTTNRINYYLRDVTGLNHTAAKQFEQGDYQARVRTVAADGTFSEWSEYVAFTIDIPVPAKPVIISPSGDITDSFPTFEWTGDDSSSSYSLWVSNATTQARVIYRTEYDGTSYVHFNPLPDGTYYAWVRAFNTVGEYSLWSDFVEFTIDAPVPAAPVINAPGAVTSNTSPLIAWNAVAGAAKYDLWVNNLTTGQAQIIRQQNISYKTPYFDTPTLAQGSYVAWVRAANGNSEFSQWSKSYSFTIDILPPSTPTMLEPTGALGSQTITTTNPTFKWTAAARAVKYDLWVNNVTTGQVQIIRQKNITGTQYVALNNLPQGNYRAWVRGINRANEVGEWSTVHIFNLDEATPEIPVITAPVPNSAGSVENPNPTFAWTANFDAPLYEFRLDDQTLNKTNVVRVSNIQTKSYTIPNNQRLSEHTYVAMVRAINNSGEMSDWSASFLVRIDVPNPATPTIVGPTGTSKDRTPTFEWNHHQGSVRYEILVRDLGRAETIVLQVTSFGLDPTSQVGFYTLPDNMALLPGTYRFWIRAFNSMGTSSSWSADKSFVISASLDLKDLKIVEPAKLESAEVFYAAAQHFVQPDSDIGEAGTIATSANTVAVAVVEPVLPPVADIAMPEAAIEELMESLADPSSVESALLSGVWTNGRVAESKTDITQTAAASLLALAMMPVRRKRREE